MKENLRITNINKARAQTAVNMNSVPNSKRNIKQYINVNQGR